MLVVCGSAEEQCNDGGASVVLPESDAMQVAVVVVRQKVDERLCTGSDVAEVLKSKAMLVMRVSCRRRAM